MKSAIFAFAFVMLATTSAFAGGFNYSKDTLQFTTGAVEGSVFATDEKLTTFKLGAHIMQHQLYGANADLFASVQYNNLSEDFTLGFDYKVSKSVSAKTSVYGTVGTSYTVMDGGLNGNWGLSPAIGAKFAFSDKLAAFTEVGNSWNISNAWTNTGGYAKIGVDYTITSNLFIEPAVVHTFNTGANSTNAELKVGVSF